MDKGVCYARLGGTSLVFELRQRHEDLCEFEFEASLIYKSEFQDSQDC